MKVAAALALALGLAGAANAAAQESRFRLNPYAGWYHYDESSFEAAFQDFDVSTDPVYGARLAIGGFGGWSLDLAYGRVKVDVRYPTPDATELASADATIQLFYAALDWHLPLTGPLDLFLSGGAGAMDTGSYGVSDGRTEVLVNYGAGLAVPVGSLRLRADLKDQVDFCEAPEDFGGASIDTCLEDDALHNIELTGGVEIPL